MVYRYHLTINADEEQKLTLDELISALHNMRSKGTVINQHFELISMMCAVDTIQYDYIGDISNKVIVSSRLQSLNFDDSQHNKSHESFADANELSDTANPVQHYIQQLHTSVWIHRDL